jgi:hypothetical protein
MFMSSRPLLGTLAEASGALLRPKTDLQRAIVLVVRIKLVALFALSCALHLTASKPPAPDAEMAKHFFQQAAATTVHFTKRA